LVQPFSAFMTDYETAHAQTHIQYITNLQQHFRFTLVTSDALTSPGNDLKIAAVEFLSSFLLELQDYSSKVSKTCLTKSDREPWMTIDNKKYYLKYRVRTEHRTIYVHFPRFIRLFN